MGECPACRDGPNTRPYRHGKAGAVLALIRAHGGFVYFCPSCDTAWADPPNDRIDERSGLRDLAPEGVRLPTREEVETLGESFTEIDDALWESTLDDVTRSAEESKKANEDEDSQLAAPFEVDGDRLIARAREGLPKICFKCGTKRRLGSRDLTFNWEAPSRFGVSISLLHKAMRQRKHTLVLPLCKDCDRAWGRARLAMGVCIGLVMAAGIIAPIAYIVGVWLLVLVVLGYASMLVFVVWSTKTKTCEVVAVNAVSMILRGFHPKALARVGSPRSATSTADS